MVGDGVFLTVGGIGLFIEAGAFGGIVVGEGVADVFFHIARHSPVSPACKERPSGRGSVAGVSRRTGVMRRMPGSCWGDAGDDAYYPRRVPVSHPYRRIGMV